MKRVIAIAAFTAVALALGLAGEASAKDTKAIEQTLMKLEHDWTDALLKKDTATIGKLLADNWGGIGALGSSTKAQYLASITSGD
ncbi:MAG: hypothetical protein ACLPM8_15830 [Myxococcaceae bacterium]